MGQANRHPLEVRGRPASPGIGIGCAYVLERRKVQVVHSQISPEQVAGEESRFHQALKIMHDELEQIKSRLPQGEHASVLSAQQLMLSDPNLIADTINLIRNDFINAEWALMQTTDAICKSLDAAADDYLRQRAADVAFLTERLLRTLLGDTVDEIAVPADAVLVAHDLSPADTASLHHHRAAGIVTQVGGPTSHSAIMARALGIPAVVGVESQIHLVDEVNSGDTVIVDGVRGRVHIRPPQGVIDRYSEELVRYLAFEETFAHEQAMPATTLDGRRFRLCANLALDAELDGVLLHGAEGVGLYRTEYMFMNREKAPTEEEHYRCAKRVLQRCAPHSVTFRTFDLGSDKPCRFLGASAREANPAMGLRSLRLSLRHRSIFLDQLRGLLRAAVHGPLKILLPLVSGLSELREALAVIEEAKAGLTDIGLPYAEDVPVGIMIEVPAAAIMADVLAAHVDFLSIGTNDLIQYSLAIDRENEEVGYLYEAMHPAILRMIATVAAAGKSAKVPVSVCGEMASDPRLAWILLGLGVTELSVHPSVVPVLKNMIRQSNFADMEAMATSVLEAQTTDMIKAQVRHEMSRRFPEHMLHGGGSL
jgi:phosphotransferase system enzyme I (PtsI)